METTYELNQPRYSIRIWLGIATVILVAGLLSGGLLFESIAPAGFAPLDGFAYFSVVYVFAQALERLMDPVTKVAEMPAHTARRALAQADLAVEAAEVADRAGSSEATRSALASSKQERAAAAAVLDQHAARRGIAMWATASALAMAGAGSMGFLLLAGVGVADAPAWLDIFVTGLIVGAGTKPIHELIKRIEDKKSKA